MANVRTVRRQNQGFAEVTDADNILSGGFNTPTIGGPPGGTPAAGTVTYFTNSGGFLVRTNSAGLSTAIGPLFTRVATTDAELAACLASTDDFFIVAGAYSFDVSATVIGVGSRTIWGAGMDKVTITLTTGGPPGSLDFTPSQTISGGVVLKEVTVTSSAAAVGPGLVMGTFGCINVRALGTPGVTANSFFGCYNLVNCIAAGIDVVGGAGYALCVDLVNCRVIDFTHFGFSGCVRLANCYAIADAIIVAVPDNSGFATCIDLVNCTADYLATTTVFAPHHGFFLCENVSNGRAIGPAGGLVLLLGFTGCFNLSSCTAQEFETNYATTAGIAACDGETSVFSNYESCAGAVGSRALGGTVGFAFCFQMSGCDADSAWVNGFASCAQVSGSFSTGNGAAGFSSCEDLSSCEADGNTTFGYLDCRGITASDATGNGSGPQSGCTRISLNTTTFDDIITPTALAADADDYDLNDAQIARLSVSGGADRTVTGIDVSMHPSARIDLINVDATFNIILADADVGSAAANRIITGTSASITIAPDGAARLLYDPVSTMWRVVQS